MASKKSKTTTIKSREELESVMGEYAVQVLERDRLLVQLEQKIAEIRAAYEQPLAACVEVGNGLFEDMQAWATLNPDAFKARKSLELLHGTLGFRSGTPAVRQVSGVKAEHSIELLSASAAQFVRVKCEIDKEAILSALSMAIIKDADLQPYGLRVERAETFYTDIKREDGKEVK